MMCSIAYIQHQKQFRVIDIESFWMAIQVFDRWWFRSNITHVKHSEKKSTAINKKFFIFSDFPDTSQSKKFFVLFDDAVNNMIKQ